MTDVKRFDVVVVGAGPAGAHVAAQLALAGRTVAIVERRAFDEAGAQWHNGVVAWQFAEAGLPPPIPDEITPGAGTGHMFGPDGTPAGTITDAPTVRADMAVLGRSLRAAALTAGVEIFDRVGHIVPQLDESGRMQTIEIRQATPRGTRDIGGARGARGNTDEPADIESSGSTDCGLLVRLEADLFIDAAGHTGVLRRHAPSLNRWCPPVTGDELCSATDAVLAIDDARGAEVFLTARGAVPGDTITVLGNAGGWSTWVVRPSEDLTRVAVLVGCVANGRYGTGPKLLADLRAAQPWLGEVLEVGSGVIPLRRPYARFTAPGLALVGDAACQVFPAHASGIGTGLLAGRMLIDAIVDAEDCGDERALWRYQYAFQSRFGGWFAALDGFRRMSTELGTEGVGAMVRAGLFDADVARAVLDQRWGQPSVSRLPRMISALVTSPKIAKVMVPRLGRGALLRSMGGRYPSEVDLEALAKWDARVERLLGRLPS